MISASGPATPSGAPVIGATMTPTLSCKATRGLSAPPPGSDLNGLGSWPQYSVAGYADVIRATLGLPADRWIVCGLSIGHPDPAAVVNTFVPERLLLVDFVDWQQ